MYQVIARKYRPQRFEDVVGQEHVTQTLANAIQQNRIAHAYLFVGPRGTGKTTIARIFAKCLNCTGGPKANFDDSDPRCQEIAEGRSLDVLEIDGASNRGIEEIRELRETVKYSPANSKFKIYIIDEVHMLTKEAFNALLKTLEEPPPHVKFMFATTEPEKVLPTILSRCQRFDLRRIPMPLMIQHLAHIARQEKVQIEPAALQAIARGADGALRDAESTLDQLISFCGQRIVESDVLSMFGLTAPIQILELAAGILDGQTDLVLRRLDQLTRQGKDLGRLLGDLLSHFRNLLIYQVSGGDLNLLEVTETEGAALKQQSSRLHRDGLTRILDALTDAETRLREVSSKKIMLELTLLKAIQARHAVEVDTLLKRLQQLRRQPDSPDSELESVSAQSARAEHSTRSLPPASPSGAPEPARPSTPGSPRTGFAFEQLGELWNQILEALGRASPFTRSYLLEAHPVSFDQQHLVIGFDPEFPEHLALVDNPKSRALLQTKLEELGFANPQVRFILAQTPPHWIHRRVPSAAEQLPPAVASPARSSAEARAETKPASAFSVEDFKNDPLIKQALEIFKAQIVEVRS